MKVAVVSDLHGKKESLGYLEKITGIYQISSFIVLGDVSSWKEGEFIDLLLDYFEKNSFGAYVIWGNNDDLAVQEKIKSSRYNAHLVLRDINGRKIFGMGYSEEAENLDGAKIKDNILITHTPPSKEILKRRFSNAPRFHLSGHLHEFQWVREYKSVTHIQVPALFLGRFAIFDLESGRVEFCKI